MGLALDGLNLYVQGNHNLRRIVIVTSAVTTPAGSAGVAGYADGLKEEARFNDPWGIHDDVSIKRARAAIEAPKELVASGSMSGRRRQPFLGCRQSQANLVFGTCGGGSMRTCRARHRSDAVILRTCAEAIVAVAVRSTVQRVIDGRVAGLADGDAGRGARWLVEAGGVSAERRCI